MRFYWLTLLSGLLCIFFYLLGSRDQMDDVTSLCQTKYQFVADGKEFVCIPSSEYFQEK